MVARDVMDQARGLFDDLDDELLEDQVAEAPVPQLDESPVPDAEPEPVPSSPTFDLSSVDSVREAAEKAEALKNYLEKVKLDAANAERQRVQNEMRREQGTTERAQQYHQWLVDQLESGADPEALKKEIPLYVTANAGWAQAQVLTQLAQQAIEMAAPETKSALQALLDRADSPEAITEATGHILNAVTEKSKTDMLSSLDFDALKEHPRFGDWLTSQVKAKMEEEMSAQKTQASARPNAPKVPSGAAVAGDINIEQYLSMDEPSRQRYLTNLTEEQEDALMTALYESARGVSS